MIALVTGASTGIGRDISVYLSELGYDLIITARNYEKLRSLKSELKTRVKIITADLSKPENAVKLYEECEKYNIDLLVNNAGLGVVGKFEETSLETELELINVNVSSMHVLFKLFLAHFKGRNHGKILNVASSAGFYPGPLMAAYYASKNYVVNISQAVQRELKEDNSRVSVSVLCPGPVQTEFNKRAGVTNSFSPADSRSVARYAVDKTLEGKFYIVPGFKIKMTVIAGMLAPAGIKSAVVYRIQKNKKPLDTVKF